MEDKTFKKDLDASVVQQKLNRKQLRKIYGGAKSGRRSNAPRCITSRRPLLMPENWQGWRNWTLNKKKVR